MNNNKRNWLDQRKSFQKHPVEQPENPVDRAEGPVLPNAPQGFFLG